MRFGGLIIAIVLAAVAAIIVLRSSSNNQPAPQPSQSPSAEAVKSVNIYVAAKSIPVGTKITADMVAVQPWPEHLVLEGFVKADGGSNAIVGTVARSTFQAQEPILMNRLANANDPNFLAGELPKGMRIMTIATNEVEGVAGFVFPGDHVDVLLTHEVEQKEGGEDNQQATKKEPVTETLLTNAKVVAVDQRSSSDGATDKEGKLSVPRSVSLMVSLNDAQRLRLGAKEGTLTLALRSITDQESADPLTLTQSGDISQFNGSASAGNSPDGVRVLRGAPGDVKETTDVNALRAASGATQATTGLAPAINR